MSSNSTSEAAPDSTPALVWDPLFLIALLAGHVDAKRLATAFMAWVVYDFMITIDDSINLFWTYRWSISKMMFLISRYNTLFTVSAILAQISIPSPSASYCNATPWIGLVGSTILIIIIDLAMVTRVYALWNRDRRLLIGVLLLWAIHIGAFIGLLSHSYIKGFFFPQMPPFTGCVQFTLYANVWIAFPVSIAFEVMIISLTVYKSWSMAIQRGIRTPLYTLLLEDGVSYFLIIVASQALTFGCIMVPTAFSIPVYGSYPSIPIAGVACSRLFIRLQRLLITRGQGLSEFSTRDLWSSNAPEFTMTGGIVDSEAGSTRLPRRVRLHATGDTTNAPEPHQDSLELESDIGMENISKLTVPSVQGGHDDSVSIHVIRRTVSTRGHEMPDRITGVEVEVRIDGEGPEPFTYGSGKSVLDSSPRFPGDLSASPGSEDIGSLTVSRMGRYD